MTDDLRRKLARMRELRDKPGRASDPEAEAAFANSVQSTLSALVDALGLQRDPYLKPAECDDLWRQTVESLLPDWRFDWHEHTTRAHPPGREPIYLRPTRWTDPHAGLMGDDGPSLLESGATVGEVVARARADVGAFRAYIERTADPLTARHPDRTCTHVHASQPPALGPRRRRGRPRRGRGGVSRRCPIVAHAGVTQRRFVSGPAT